MLKPGGIMVLETPDASSPKVRRLGADYARFWKPSHTYAFTPDNLARLAAPVGFEVLPEPGASAVLGAGPLLAPYFLVRQVYRRLRVALGVHKEFQLFLRREDKQP
ncbi:MAG: methyltransferase domain-containing protein [Pseudomonadota bacterium]